MAAVRNTRIATDSHNVITLSSHASRHKSGELKEEYQRLLARVNRGKTSREVCPFLAELYGRVRSSVGFGQSDASFFTRRFVELSLIRQDRVLISRLNWDEFKAIKL
jgi:hypothetical protein